MEYYDDQDDVDEVEVSRDAKMSLKTQNLPAFNKDRHLANLQGLMQALRVRSENEEKSSFLTPNAEKLFVPGTKHVVGRFIVQPNISPNGELSCFLNIKGNFSTSNFEGIRITFVAPFRPSDPKDPKSPMTQTRHAITLDELRILVSKIPDIAEELDHMTVGHTKFLFFCWRTFV